MTVYFLLMASLCLQLQRNLELIFYPIDVVLLHYRKVHSLLNSHLLLRIAIILLQGLPGRKQISLEVVDGEELLIFEYIIGQTFHLLTVLKIDSFLYLTIGIHVQLLRTKRRQSFLHLQLPHIQCPRTAFDIRQATNFLQFLLMNFFNLLTPPLPVEAANSEMFGVDNNFFFRVVVCDSMGTVEKVAGVGEGDPEFLDGESISQEVRLLHSCDNKLLHESLKIYTHHHFLNLPCNFTLFRLRCSPFTSFSTGTSKCSLFRKLKMLSVSPFADCLHLFIEQFASSLPAQSLNWSVSKFFLNSLIFNLSECSYIFFILHEVIEQLLSYSELRLLNGAILLSLWEMGRWRSIDCMWIV